MTATSPAPVSLLLCDPSVLEVLPVSICVFDAEGGVLAASRRLLEHTGATVADLQSWDNGALLHPDDQAAVSRGWKDALRAGEPFMHEFRVRRSDGGYRWHRAETTPVRDGNGSITHWISVFAEARGPGAAESAGSRYGEMLRLIADLLPANVAYIDREQRYAFVNESYRRLYGADPDELVGKSVWEFIGARMYDEVAHVIRDALDGKPAETEVDLHRPDGSTRRLRAANVPDIGPDGEVRGFVSLVTDVTEQAQAAEIAASNAALTSMVADRLPIRIAYVDTNERYRFVNAGYAAWFGLEPGEVPGLHVKDVVGPDAYRAVMGQISRALSGEPVEFEDELSYAHAGLRIIRARYLPHRLPDGSVGGFAALVEDITAERKAAELGEQAQRRLQLLADVGEALNRSVGLGDMAGQLASLLRKDFADVVTVDVREGGRIRRLAAQCSERITTEAPALLSVPPGRDDEDGVIRTVLRDGQPQYWRRLPEDLRGLVGSEERRRALAEVRAVSGIWAPIAGDDEVAGVLGVLRAVGSPLFDAYDYEFTRELARRIGNGFERVALMGRLKDALDAKDSFIGFVSHELKTPLTTLIGFSDILERRAGQLPQDVLEDVAAHLVEQTRRLNEIIENLLMLARGERGAEDEPHLLRRVVPRVVADHRWRHQRREVSIRSEGQIGTVLAPPGWLEQVVENFLSNAEKYSPARTPIDVEIRTEPGHITLAVLDRGSGISEEQAREVFEPFFRASPAEGAPGIGLGLTVCQKLIERLGGEVWLRPREGGGTEAGFRLPTLEELEE